MLLPFPTFAPDHIHPILENFTSALIPVSMVSDAAGRIFCKPSLHSVGWWTLVYATAITPLTALAGLWWKHQLVGMLPPVEIEEHMWLGISLTVSFIILLLWRRKSNPPSIPYFSYAVLILVVLLAQGALGGDMVFGN